MRSAAPAFRPSSPPTGPRGAMAALVADARHRAGAEPDGRGAATPGIETPLTGPIDEDAAKTLVSAYGIATPRRTACRSRAEAEAARAAMAGPVVAKVLDPDILHKSDVGGVHVGIGTAAALEEALDAIDGVSNAGYLIEAMAPDGLDLILGARNDPSFGPTVLLGLGGTAAEAIDDVAVALAPLGPAEVDGMIGLARRQRALRPLARRPRPRPRRDPRGGAGPRPADRRTSRDRGDRPQPGEGLCGRRDRARRAGRASRGLEPVQLGLHRLPVMPGLVPGIHVGPPARLCLVHIAVPRDVDARNKSTVVRFRWAGPGARRRYSRVPGSFAGSGHGLRPARTRRPFPRCHPGLDPGSRPTGTVLARLPWTPDQVRGDSGGAETVSLMGTEPAPES